MEKCMMCPRKCGVDRDKGKIGYCGESYQIRVARTSLHQWEEPCITGEKGSGTVFFSGCNMKCVFCQNHNIADNSIGRAFSIEELADAFLRLQESDATNINLVTAGHFIKEVVKSLELARSRGLKIPIVYNSSAYECVESLRMLDGLVDIYLPDCKFMDAEVSFKYANTKNYFAVAQMAIEEMVRQVGEPFMTENGIMKKGVIVRHLILPGHTKDSMNILRYLYETYQNRIYVSIMNQFTPVIYQECYSNLNRRLTKREYQKVISYAIEIGIEKAYIQEGDAAKESFIPEFDCSFI